MLNKFQLSQRVQRHLLMFSLLVPALAGVWLSAPLPALAASLSNPSWWNGQMCDTGRAPAGVYGKVAGVWNGLQACYPTDSSGSWEPANHQPDFNTGDPADAGQAVAGAWECVELSERYLYLQYGLAGVTANGTSLVDNYYSHYQSTKPAMSKGSGYNSGGSQYLNAGAYPAVNDVVSITWSNGLPHAAIVTAVSIDGSGNGTISLFQQNAYGNNNTTPWQNGYLTISGYKVLDAGNHGLQLFKWLHFSGNANTNPTISTKLAYAIGTDESGNAHLYEFWPNSNLTTWNDRDLNAATGVSTNLVGQPSAAWLKQSGQIVHDVFATGVDGHIHEFYYQSNAWNTQDLAGYNGSLSPTFTQSPFGYSYSDSNSNPHHSVSVVGTDGNLYNYRWPGATTTWDLTQIAKPTGVNFTGNPSVYAYNSNGDQLLYINATDGKIREYGNSFGTTIWSLLNTFSPPAPYTAMGSPTAYSYSDSVGTRHFVYFSSSNGQTYSEYYDPASGTKGWHGPYSMLSGGVVPSGSPNGHPSYQSSPPLQFIYTATTTGNGLQEVYAGSDTPTSWTNIGIGPGTSLITGSPVAFTYLDATAKTTHNIFFSETDGNIHLEYYPNTSNGWSIVPLPTISGVSFVGATPSAYVVPTNP